MDPNGLSVESSPFCLALVLGRGGAGEAVPGYLEFCVAAFRHREALMVSKMQLDLDSGLGEVKNKNKNYHLILVD